jgi:hypothetical protein
LLIACLVCAALVLLVLAVLPLPAAGLDGRATVRWELAAGAAGAGPPEAIAVDATGERLAVGDRRGVLVGQGPGSLTRILHRGPVQDVVFLPDGNLLAATASGLFHRDAEGRVTDRTPAPGARNVAHVASAQGWVVAATGAGAYVSRDLRGWRRLDAELPSGAVQALAFAPSPAGADLWLIVDEKLWRVRLDEEGRVSRATRQGPPFAGQAARGLRDLHVTTSEVLVLGLGVLVRGDPERGDWEVFRPTLPAGAEARRLLRAAGSLWIATDRGLVGAASAAGPWHRAAGVAATSEVRALAAWGDNLYAATTSGLLVGRRRLPPTSPLVPSTVSVAPAVGPPIEAVQRATLSYLELGTAETARMRRGVRRRGWLPLVALRLGADRRRFHSDESDEVFTSGALRRLHDSDLDHTRGYEAALTLSWDLGDTAFHPEEIDVSKEAREIIELRDDVLDEVNQLYFERVRILLDLEVAIRDGSDSARQLARADELAAGLDAWTGGWFGRQLDSRSRATPHHSSGGSS